MEIKQGLTILVVDDNPVNTKLLESTLIHEGYLVTVAMDGKQAREIASKTPPDLIILDVMMPEEDGFEVLDQLKKNPQTGSIPVIFLTGRDELDAKMRGFDLGAVDYITKPFQVKEVLARVRLHLKLSLATNSLISAQAEKLRQIQHAQASMLVAPDQLPEARFSVCYRSLLEAGGDFYDILQISEGIFGYFVADVSGHDLETSYITAALKALLKQNCLPVYQPDESMRMINDVLVEILPEGKYLTACYAKLNRKTKSMAIVNGGHPPVVYLPIDGEARFIDLKGDVIGVFKEVYFGREEIGVKEGDRFFIFTDGLLERPSEGKLWPDSLGDLLRLCGSLRGIPLPETSDRLMELMDAKSSACEDDVVVLGIEV